MVFPVLLLIGSAALIYVGCENFANGIVWVGRKLGIAQNAVGAVLAAFETALPESVVTCVAVFLGATPAPKDIGVGAALGGPHMCATGRELRLGLLHLTRFGCNSTLAYGPADPADSLLSTCVGWVREVGHHRGNRKSIAVRADDVIEQGVVFAEPMHIRDQLLGRRSFTLIANIDEHQARTFDTL